MSNIALLDLDAMLHIVASVQFKAGNLDNPAIVKAHVNRFISSIKTNSKCTEVLMFYQKIGFTNFRNVILPEYKGHRTTSDAIALWKPTIIEAFEEAGAFGLQHIESDDALSIMADVFEGKCTVISSDKDMCQVPATHYNPYKTNISTEDRWKTINYPSAMRFFWTQVLTGDSTDMPNNLCGIEMCGPATADKYLDNDLPYRDVIEKRYTEKYGSKEGFIRAKRTYQMVRLLELNYNAYINEAAGQEVKTIVDTYKDYIQPITDSVEGLFGHKPKFDPTYLFKK